MTYPSLVSVLYQQDLVRMLGSNTNIDLKM
jgi:hypothetical protein